MRYSTLICIAAVLAMFSCDDIFEKNLSKKSVRIIAPADNVVAVEGPMTFMWDETEGATGYHLRVVSPSFLEASAVLADTVLYNDTLSVKRNCRLELLPGNYQWSLSALNSAYRTREVISTFTVIAKPEEPGEPEEPEPEELVEPDETQND